MASLTIPRPGVARMASSPLSAARTISTIVNLASDATMTTATDDITVATLPKGTVVLAAGIEQVTVGTGTGTLVARVGSTTMSGTLASTASVGTFTANASQVPVILTADTGLNVLGATAVRTDGKIRVWAVVVEGFEPAYPVVAQRDTSL